MNPRRFIPVLFALALTGLIGAGCSKQARLARLGHRADDDYAAGKLETAEIEYRNYLHSGPDAHAIGRLGLIFSYEGRMLPAFQCLRKSDELDPKDPEIKTALAAAYLSFDDISAAYRNAKAALSLQTTNTKAMMLLSETARAPDEVEAAKAYLRALPGQPDRFPEFHVSLATIALKERDPKAAEAELQTALVRDPKSAEAHYRLSQIYYHNGDTNHAMAELRTAANLAAWRSPIRLDAADFELHNGGGETAARAGLNEVISHAPDFVPARTALMHLDFNSKLYDATKKDIAAVIEKDPDSYDAALQMGLVDLSLSDWDAAIKDLSTLEARRPYAPTVKYYLGLASMDKGDMQKARRFLTQAAELNTNYVEPLMLLAQLDLREKNASDAVQRLLKLIHQQPKLLEARLLLAEAYLTHQEPDKAMEIYREVAQLLPDNPRFPYLIGLALEQDKDWNGARQSFSKSLTLDPNFQLALDQLVEIQMVQHDFDAALQLIQAKIKADPKSGHLWMLAARVYRIQNHDQQAEECLNRAISLDPGLVSAYVSLAQLYVADHKEQQALDKLNAIVSKTNDLSALMALGVIHEALQDYPAAAQSYEKILTINPKFLPALNNLAYLYSENLNQLDKAFEDAQKANALNPYNPDCADTLAWVLYKRGDYSRALPLFKQAAEGEPASPDVQYHLGMDNYMLGSEAAARVAFQAALSSPNHFSGSDTARERLAVLSTDPKASDPKTIQVLETAVKSDPRDPIAVSRLAEVDERAGSFDKAAEMCEQGLKANPKDAPMMARLAGIYADHLKRPDDALKMARDAHDLDPENPQVCAVLGRLNFSHGNIDDAISLLQKAADQDQAPARVYSDLAQANYAAGKIQEAVQAAQTAISRAGGNDPQDQSFLTLVNATSSAAAAKAALPQAQATLQQDPHNLPALMVSGISAQMAGDAKSAEGFYETALSVFPKFPPALRQSAVLWAGPLGDQDKAMTLAQSAHLAYPGDPQLGKILGLGAYRAGDYSHSSQFLQEVLDHSNDAEALYYLGMDYYKLQRPFDSKRALQKAIAMKLPEDLDSDAKKTLSQIK